MGMNAQELLDYLLSLQNEGINLSGINVFARHMVFEEDIPFNISEEYDTLIEVCHIQDDNLILS